MQEKAINQFDIAVEPHFLPQHSDATISHYVFAYTITITNVGNSTARLLSRHWIITDGNNQVEEVRGEGVVGEQPQLRPGEHFQYTSSAVLKTPVGSMQGCYHMVSEEQDYFQTDIPPFRLAVPNAVN